MPGSVATGSPSCCAVLRRRCGLRPATEELEITESALVDDVDGAVTTFHALRAKGRRIALDDFDTGYSALGYLRRFPFDTLKINRSFVSDIVNEGESRVLVETILAMVRALGMSGVAEGAERPEEAEVLRARGCAMLQGYLISRPLDADKVGAFLADWPQCRNDTLPLFAPEMA